MVAQSQKNIDWNMSTESKNVAGAVLLLVRQMAFFFFKLKMTAYLDTISAWIVEK